MMGLCFVGLFFGLVLMAVLACGIGGRLIAKVFFKKSSDSVEVYKISKAFTLATAYYVIAGALYFASLHVQSIGNPYVSCSDEEGTELLIMIVYIIVTVSMLLTVKNADCKNRVKGKIYTRTANILMFGSLLFIAAVFLFDL